MDRNRWHPVWVLELSSNYLMEAKRYHQLNIIAIGTLSVRHLHLHMLCVSFDLKDEPDNYKARKGGQDQSPLSEGLCNQPAFQNANVVWSESTTSFQIVPFHPNLALGRMALLFEGPRLEQTREINPSSFPGILRPLLLGGRLWNSLFRYKKYFRLSLFSFFFWCPKWHRRLSLPELPCGSSKRSYIHRRL